jgi:hypothetical protein
MRLRQTHGLPAALGPLQHRGAMPSIRAVAERCGMPDDLTCRSDEGVAIVALDDPRGRRQRRRFVIGHVTLAFLPTLPPLRFLRLSKCVQAGRWRLHLLNRCLERFLLRPMPCRECRLSRLIGCGLLRHSALDLLLSCLLLAPSIVQGPAPLLGCMR